MKKIILITFIASFIYACDQSPKENLGFEIEGKISGYDSGMVRIKKQLSGEWITIDSANSENGEFKLAGDISSPEMLYLFFGNDRNYSTVFIGNSIINFTANIDSLKNPTVTGSKSNDEFTQYSKELKVFENKSRDLYKQYMEAEKEGNKELVKEIETNYDKLYEEQINFVKNYISTHTNSFVTPYIITRQLVHSLNVNELDSILNTLDTKIDSSVYVIKLKERVDVLRKVEIGKQAIDFTLNDTLGNPISLSSFKGKFVLIDFWAAWCRPCRAENPNNVKLYEKYKDKGFEILGVSFDETRDAWVKAIKDDGLTWSQVSDLKGWKCEAGDLYGVRSIPHTVLLDKEGIIIAKNLRGEELNKKIAKLLD